MSSSGRLRSGVADWISPVALNPPRGMEFLYSANRFNVAISRARCLALLVASPHAFEADCRTPRQNQLANAFCRYLELSEETAV